MLKKCQAAFLSHFTITLEYSFISKPPILAIILGIDYNKNSKRTCTNFKLLQIIELYKLREYWVATMSDFQATNRTFSSLSPATSRYLQKQLDHISSNVEIFTFSWIPDFLKSSKTPISATPFAPQSHNLTNLPDHNTLARLTTPRHI